RAEAGDLRQDLGTALFGAAERLQDQGARTFAANEAIAPAIPRAAGALGFVVAAAQREHRAEASDADGCDRRLRPAGDHDFGAPLLNPAVGFTDGVRAGRTSAGVRVARTAEAVGDGDLARGHVGDERGDEVGTDLAR